LDYWSRRKPTCLQDNPTRLKRSSPYPGEGSPRFLRVALRPPRLCVKYIPTHTTTQRRGAEDAEQRGGRDPAHLIRSIPFILPRN